MVPALVAGDMEAYFIKTLGLKIRIKPTVGSSLPFYLTSLFSVGTAEIEGRRLLFCAVTGDGTPSPAQLKKHAAELRERTDLEPVFVLPGLSSWDRARLIEGRIAFVVPGRQLYLPTLLIDLREHFARERERPDRLSYPAQCLILVELLRGGVEGKTVRELSRELAYSATSMSRAVRELLALGLVETAEGKAKPLHFTSGKSGLWKAALPHLLSPVKTVMYGQAGRSMPDLPFAGISALAKLSMLNEDGSQTYAMAQSAAKPLVEKGLARRRAFADDDIRLELWAYDPRVPAGQAKATVDPLSLYLSLASENDERVRKALDDLLKGIL
jgi:hypothetical protein